jgi:glycosyltransferase involved in cell wall biosynthesis
VRVLFVVHDFFPRFFGGTERYVLNIAHQVQQMGHSPEVLTYGLADPEDSFTGTLGSLLTRSYVFEGVPVLSVRHTSMPPTINHRIADPEIAEAVGLLLDRSSYDVVHIAHPMRMAAAYLAVKQRGIPLVLTLTDFWLLCPRGRFYKPDHSPCNSPENGNKCVRECHVDSSIRARYVEARQLFEAADVLVAPSAFLIEVFRRNGWQRAIRQISHGVDFRLVPSSPRRARPTGKVHIGYTGLVARFKGVDLLVRTFVGVKGSNLLLKIYGNVIWEEKFLRELDGCYAEDARIQLMNRYDHADISAVMADIDVMVVPSTTLESYGLVVVESLAHGIPVIASDMVGSAFEFIRDGVNGAIFPTARPEELRRILEEVASDPETVERWRRRIAPPPRLEDEAYQLENLYRTAIGLAR